MKAKHIGLLLLVLVIIAAGVYSFLDGRKIEQISVKGYIGGEKIGLVDDPEVIKILKDKYHITLDYQKAGSLDMIRLDHTGRDYLWPSSQTALDLYEKTFGKPGKSEIIFNTPIVLYTRQLVADALVKAGYLTQVEGVYFMDMANFLPVLEEGQKWTDLGLNLYGPVVIATTDPTKSNSGNMFSGLLANMLNGGTVVTDNSEAAITPRLQAIFRRLGYMETSSADIFSQFLKIGVGAKPLVAGYESQLIEFAHTNPRDYAQIKDDVVLVYPVPTVWSSHVYIALSDNGKKVVDALMDEQVQRLAWERHGFRTGVNSANADISKIGVTGMAPVISRIIPMPDSQVMSRLIQALSAP